MNEITQELLERFRAQAAARPVLKTLHAVMSKTDMADLAYVPAAAAKLNGDFAVELTTRGVTYQKKSGRCWLFAVLNILRERISETCGLEKFELSANYLAFYDKLEKSNNFLELIIAHADKPLNDRMMEYVLEGFGDGGYWDMAVDLVKKYGVVPASVMPETYQSTHTAKFDALLDTLLRKDAVQLRALIAAGGDAQGAKEAMLEEVYRMECIAFGEPPATFRFEYRDRDKVFHAERGLTGRSFYEKFVGDALDDYINVTNHPTHGLPMNLYYVFHYIGSMANRDIVNLNLTVEEMEALTVKQLRDGEPVWFGCDSGAFGNREEGVWDPASMDYSGLMDGIDFRMSKGDRLETHDSFATHAMIFVGVNFDENGTPDRWKIENSWGESAGKSGYFVCSADYYREFVYEVIVRKKHLTDAQRALLDAEPVRIQPWEGDWL